MLNVEQEEHAFQAVRDALLRSGFVPYNPSIFLAEKIVQLVITNIGATPTASTPHSSKAAEKQPQAVPAGELCGCGRPADYTANDGGLCCNKYGIHCKAAPQPPEVSK